MHRNGDIDLASLYHPYDINRLHLIADFSEKLSRFYLIERDVTSSTIISSRTITQFFRHSFGFE